MERYIATDKFRQWVMDNSPGGVAKLSLASGQSVSMIMKIINNSYYHQPKQWVMQNLALAMKLTVDELFPEVKDES